MDVAVGGEEVAAEEVKLGAVGVGDYAASFFDDQATGCNVPRVEAVFPEEVDASCSEVG